MQLPGIIILLARQRSGTNAIRSVLEKHPDIACLPEVFSIREVDSKLDLNRTTNYWGWLERYAARDIRSVFPDRTEDVFLDFMEFLRGFSDKRYLLVDVKSSCVHFFQPPWAQNFTMPYFFELVRKHRLRVLRVTRRNYLRFEVSNAKSLSGAAPWHIWEDGYKDPTVTIDVARFLKIAENHAAEDNAIAQAFAGYRGCYSGEYADIFEGSALRREWLSGLAGFLDVKDAWENEPKFRKQASLSLGQTIENWPEVAGALRGSPFEYCLEDEPAHQL